MHIAITKNKKYWLKTALFVLIAILLSMYLYMVDLGMVLAHLLEIGWKVLWIVPVSAMGYLFATLAWKYCMRSESEKIPFADLLIARHIGETLAIINPTNVIAGDGAKVYLLKKRGVDPSVSMRSVLLSRALIILSSITLMLMAAFILIPITKGEGYSWITMASTLVVAVVTILIWRSMISKKLILYLIFKRLFSYWSHFDGIPNLLSSIKKVNVEMAKYHKKYMKRLYIAYFYSLVHWFFGIIEFYIILLLLGIDINWAGAFVMEMGVSLIKNMGAFIPAQLGIEEAGNKIMLEAIGVSIPLMWLAVSAVRRSRQIFWLAIGVILFWIEQKRMF